jgi:1-acyl-sn-glycerol-3-phosphate acyltransferase
MGRALWYRLIQSLAYILEIALWGIRVRGQNRVPRQGGGILISNHQSFLDLIFLGATFPRTICYVARTTLQSRIAYRLLTWPFKLVHIRRGEADLNAVREMVEAARAGYWVLLFPEGTRTRDGRVGPFTRGFLLAARRAGVPVVPARIRGSFEVWPRWQPLPSVGGRVRVEYFDPRDASRDEDLIESLRREVYA